jgi:hypothetical protein
LETPQREADLVRDRFAGRDLNDGEEGGGDNPSVKLAAAYMAASKPSAIAAEAKREQAAEDAKRKEDEALETQSKPKLASHTAAATVAVAATTTSRQAPSLPTEATAAAVVGKGGASKGGAAHASDSGAVAEDEAKHKQTRVLSAKKLAVHAAVPGKVAGGGDSKAKSHVGEEVVEAAAAPEEAKAHAVASAANGPSKASSGAAAAAKEPSANTEQGGPGGGETNEKLENVLRRIDGLIRGYTKGASSHPDFLKHFQSGSSLPKLQGGDGRSGEEGGGVLYMPPRPPPGQKKS